MVAPLVIAGVGGLAAVGAAVAGALTNNKIAQCYKIQDKECEQEREFSCGTNFIKTELPMIAGDQEDRLAGRMGNPSDVTSASMEQMRDLAHDIEDCLDRIGRHTEEGKKEASLHFGEEVNLLVQRVKEAKERIKEYNRNGTQLSFVTPSTAVPSQSFRVVGIDEPKNQIIKLLLTDDAEGLSENPKVISIVDDTEGLSENPKVISIVGFGGSGKTTLAKEVYGCKDVKDKFPFRAWVEASKHGDDSMALLTELFGQFKTGEQAGEDDVEQLQIKISKYLSNKRYLIVLDDIKEPNWWRSIASTFPNSTRSRILVTTTFQPIATLCSRGNGYVHNMKPLDDEHSKELLRSVLRENLPWLDQSSTSIVNKCDGHPLSLDNVACYLAKKDGITGRVCEELSRSLGRHVATDEAFKKLREVLLNNYTNLPVDKFPNIKACLMYMCVFPNGCHTKRRRLIRRWLAEQYVQHNYSSTALEFADEYFQELVDQNIIFSTIGARKNTTQVKSYRAHGTMHEFMLHMAESARFITSLDDKDRRNYRHLFREGHLSSSSGRSSNQTHAHDSPAQVSRKKILEIDMFSSKEKEKEREKKENKLRAHSLTISGNAGEAVKEFLNCELLRVLDLEECDDLNDGDIDGIYDLWHLKYLSLGVNISRLPGEIQKLHCLETLDVTKTKKEITLPVEVIKLPHLAHLLGKFKLEKKSKAENIVTKKSNMQTLAGFVTDDNPAGFPTLMVGMEKLQKVKAWCNSDNKELVDAIQKFVMKGTITPYDYRSLSLCLGNSASDFPSSLQNSLTMENSGGIGYLSSMKIRGALGALSRLTQLTTLLTGLRVLCLSSTNGLKMDGDDLKNLGGLICLEYLKLVKVSLEGLVIEKKYFPQLSCLCLVQTPVLPEVKNGALKRLDSLQLLAKDLRAPFGINIEQHKVLQEIALHSKVDEETKTFFKDAAQMHPKRPRVLYLDMVDPDETGSSGVQEEQQNQAQLRSVIQHSPASDEKATVSGPSPPSDEFCSSGQIEMQDLSSRVVS